MCSLFSSPYCRRTSVNYVSFEVRIFHLHSMIDDQRERKKEKIRTSCSPYFSDNMQRSSSYARSPRIPQRERASPFISFLFSVLEHSETLPPSTEVEKKSYSIRDVPRLPRELTPFAPFEGVVEVNQRGPLFQGPGAKRDTGRYKVRPVDDENVKRAKKFAMEQSVKYVLVRQQQHQQRAQLDIIKKQQALLLMCRSAVLVLLITKT